MKKREFLISALLAGWAGLPERGHAAGVETTTLLVGFAAGGGLDQLTRLLADRLRAEWGRAVIVENRPGAAGQIAVQALKKSPANGSVLMTAPFAVPVMNPVTYHLKDQTSGVDFLPVAQIAEFAYALVVPANLPARDMRTLVAWLKEDPKRAAFGTAAIGNLPHFLGLQMGKSIGTPMNVIGYKGAGALMPDLIGGQIPMAISAEVDFVEMVKAGRLRLLATFGERRSPFSPDVPTLREAGIDLTASGWYAAYAPAGMDSGLLASIADTFHAVLSDPDVAARIRRMGLAPTPGVGPAALARITAQAIEQWVPVIRSSGVRLN